MENESDNLKPSVQDTSVQLEPTTEVAALPNKSETNGSLVQRFFKYWWLVAGLVGIALVVLLAFGVSDNREPHTAIKQFTNVYSFVPEKISRSALIPISLPEGVNKEVAQAGISFSPVVAGAWAEEDESGLVVFAPEQPLTVGVYYAVNMDTGTVQMSGDFYVDEDPAVEAVFPLEGSPAHEDTEITILFNRPMVPLTTLSQQETVDLPITISPATPGTFKWISTRNVQFVPETTLIPASNYTVEITPGLFSVDGLAVAPVTHTFTTRLLEYEYVSQGQIGYRSPIIVAFNQPVDLDKTRANITVENQAGEPVALEVTYGEVTQYDRETNQFETKPDPSKVFVYQRKDIHGRSGLWDFNTSYKVSVTGAVPLAGTRNLDAKREHTVLVPDIVKQVVAESQRTTLARPDLFDPTGTLAITFYDEVDKDRSVIQAKGLQSIVYGERCATDESGDIIRLGSGCATEVDTKTLVLGFDSNTFSTAESFAVELQRIRTREGFQMNTDVVVVPVKTYPTFAIARTVPASTASAASLRELYVCSNTPLDEAGEDGLAQYTGDVIQNGKWSQSRYLSETNTYNTCRVGEFETRIEYGLSPQTSYQFTLALEDSFGQTAESNLSFTTQTPQEKYVRFQNMQQQYNVTPPQRTTLTYAVENLESVDVHICRLEPEVFLERTVNRADAFTPPQGDGCTQVVTERISLQSLYWVTQYFQVNLADYFADTRGQYIVTFSSPLYTGTRYFNRQSTTVPRYDRTYVSVTNLAIGKKEVQLDEDMANRARNQTSEQLLNETLAAESNLYWINNNQSLAAISGATVVQYKETENTGVEAASSGFSGSNGIARVAVEKDLVGAVVRSGSDTAVISNWADTLNRTGDVRDASRTYIYTDRPIYRPGHTVHVRGIDRIGFDGSYEIWNEAEVKLEIFDSQGNRVYDTNLQQTEFGTFATDFTLPADAPLGTYWIQAFGQSSRFDVQEYVPAAFKLTAETNQAEYIDGDNIQIAVQADYYFGVPLDEGTLSYSVTAQDYYFDKYTDEYFNFGRAWYFCFSCGFGDDFLFRGEAILDENGRATIERKFTLADYFDDVASESSKLVTVSMTAKDINGRSVSMQKSFVVHKAEFYVGVKTNPSFTSVNTPVTLRVKTVDTQGKPVALSGIERQVYQVNWETFKRQEVDGGFYYRSQKKLTPLSTERISTNRQGDYTGGLTFNETGQYEVHITKTDNRGSTITTVTNVYIYGTQAISMPQNNNYELDIEVENRSLEVGDTGSLLIKSPYDKAKVLITAERGTVYDYWIVDIEGGLYLHEFPVLSGYAPNIFVSALLLAGDPEAKYGSVEYSIGTAQKELTVEVEVEKEQYLPGEAVTLTVQTKDHTGSGVPAEVSIAVADLSVLALKGNPKKDPTQFFFGGFPLSVTTASNIKNILYEVDVPLGTKGGGGADPNDLANKKRGVFKDTAFWEASVVTSEAGEATVTFVLPDNLTTWQVESIGVTKDTKLGVDYQEFTTKKDLMAVPLKPRFILPGDTFALGAQVFNQTESDAEVQVAVKSETLTFLNEQTDTVRIKAGETKTVYFDTLAPREIKAGNHTFTFTATADSFVDQVEQSIPIVSNTTFETVATANFTKEDVVVEYLYVPSEVVSGEGGLTINANATMAVFMTDALAYMASYPTGSSEQLASSLSTIGTLQAALEVPNVTGSFETIEYQGVSYAVDTVISDGLSQMYQAQTLSGGFAYYKGLPANLPLTLHVVTAFAGLEAAGYDIEDSVLQRAVDYIEFEAERTYLRNPDEQKETVVLAEYVLRLIDKKSATKLTPVVESLIADDSFVNEEISSMSLAYLAILTADGYGRGQKNRVYDALQNRIDIDGRGAYLSTNATANCRCNETPIKNTALLLKAFVVHNDEHPAMANVLRWLLAARDNQGVWGNTHNTFTVVDSMVAYLSWQHETESHFTLRGLLDGVELFGFTFEPSSVFTTFSHFVAMDELPRDTLLPLVFERENHGDQKNNLYYDMALQYYLPAESLPPRDEGITITRNLYALDDVDQAQPLLESVVGDVIKGKLTLSIPDQYSQVTIEDIIPAGFELVNFNLDTEDQSILQTGGETDRYQPQPRWLNRVTATWNTSQALLGYKPTGLGGSYQSQTRTLRPTHLESHDDRIFIYLNQLRPGVYEYEYYLRALVPGTFQHLPARAEQMYFPEVFGRTEGGLFTVLPE